MEGYQEYLKVKVTCINGRHHARLSQTIERNDRPAGHVLDEMACEDKRDVGYICRQMLRWHDKCGGTSRFASATRVRMWNRDKHPTADLPLGRIYNSRQLREEKEKHLAKKTLA
jgi:hypothetical protein